MTDATTDTTPENTPSDDDAPEEQPTMEEIEAFIRANSPQPPEQPRQQSLSENFKDVVALLAQAKRQHKLSEATVLKAWELTLMWALNNRPQPGYQYPETGDSGNGEEGIIPFPEANETITGTEDPSESES